MSIKAEPEFIEALVAYRLREAQEEIDRLNETLWVIRADGYRKADPGFPTLREADIIAWDEARRWRRHEGIELTANAVVSPDDNIAFYASAACETRFVNFRGIAWTPTQMSTVRTDGRMNLQIELVATAAPESKGPPEPVAERRLDYRSFLAIIAGTRTSPPVMLENGLMGMANHLHSDVALVDAYDGDAHVGVYRIPYANLMHIGGGAFFAGLKGVAPPTGAEG